MSSASTASALATTSSCPAGRTINNASTTQPMTSPTCSKRDPMLSVRFLATVGSEAISAVSARTNTATNFGSRLSCILITKTAKAKSSRLIRAGRPLTGRFSSPTCRRVKSTMLDLKCPVGAKLVLTKAAGHPSSQAPHSSPFSKPTPVSLCARSKSCQPSK